MKLTVASGGLGSVGRLFAALMLVFAASHGATPTASAGTCQPAPNPACTECQIGVCYVVMCPGAECAWCEGLAPQGNGC